MIYVTQASPQSMTWLTMSDAQGRGIEVSLFASPRDQPPSSEPRERDRKEAEPRPTSVERPPQEPSPAAAAPVTSAKTDRHKGQLVVVGAGGPGGAARGVSAAKSE